MTGSSSKAGGCLLVAAILAGAGIGIARGEPSAGALIGTAVGAALALIVWLVDRRRG